MKIITTSHSDFSLTSGSMGCWSEIDVGGSTDARRGAHWLRIVRRAARRALGLSTCHISTRVIGLRSPHRGATWQSEVVESDSAYPRRVVAAV